MSRVGLQIDAVDLEDVEGVFHIAAGGLNVRQRHETHGAEFAMMVGDHLRHDLIADLDQPFCEFDIAEIGPRRGDRHEYGIDSEFIHQLELPRYAPCRPGVFPAAQHADARKFAFVDIGNDVLVDVNERHVRWLRHADSRAHVKDSPSFAPGSSASNWPRTRRHISGLPRISIALSILTSTPMPASAPTWVCSRGNRLAKIASRTEPLSCSSALPKNRRKPLSSTPSRCALKLA